MATPRTTKPRVKRATRSTKGTSPSAAAGEFVRREIEHVRSGKHGARSPAQIIAIALSKARRAGVKRPVPKPGTTSERTRRRAQRDRDVGDRVRAHGKTRPSARRSRAATKALKKEGRMSASHDALSRHATEAAATRKKRTRTGD